MNAERALNRAPEARTLKWGRDVPAADMLPAPFLAIHIHAVTAITILVVGLVCLALAIVGWRAYRRSGSRALAFVSLAFLVFAGKGAFAALALWTDALRHEHLELVLSIADLAAVLLLALPLLLNLRGTAR